MPFVGIVIVTMVQFDPYVVDVLMGDLVGHDRKPSAFLVYVHLVVLCQRDRRGEASASLQQMATDVGLSKSAVQTALRHLEARQLISSQRGPGVGEIRRRVLSPWRSGVRGRR